MADDATSIEKLLDHVGEYSSPSIELFKLHAIDKSADVISTLVSNLAVFIMVALSLLIINIGCALWIGKLLGEAYYGFFIMGGLSGLLALLLHIFRQQWIKYPISNSIIKQMLKKNTLIEASAND
jgi:phosphoglycerol transferase MdoB-like AlkP superfamily enzyme